MRVSTIVLLGLGAFAVVSAGLNPEKVILAIDCGGDKEVTAEDGFKYIGVRE